MYCESDACQLNFRIKAAKFDCQQSANLVEEPLILIFISFEYATTVDVFASPLSYQINRRRDRTSRKLAVFVVRALVLNGVFCAGILIAVDNFFPPKLASKAREKMCVFLYC